VRVFAGLEQDIKAMDTPDRPVFSCWRPREWC